MSTAEVVLNNSLVYMYLPNWNAGLLNMMIFCLALGCDILNWYQLVLDSVHLLILEICHWQLDLYAIT